MIVVIQCAKKKQPAAGSMATNDGRLVKFVADPLRAPVQLDCVYAQPDDLAESGRSWREQLLEYNREGRNDLGLLPAYRLYQDPAYRLLVERFGVANVYVLSAGWGLVRADFRIPSYDITFSPVAPPDAYKRRAKNDIYADFRLPDHVNDDMVFFGGEAYRPLFCSLTSAVTATRTVFYRSGDASVSTEPPVVPGCQLRRFVTRRCTTWYYECVHAFLGGLL
ncbi:hypothetical protein [Paraburkholderia youngii]|uniref:hypothetical protein n=1 Tax=Paraburkholderia youngii TaxID=2782701 RepID=UPI003D203A68